MKRYTLFAAAWMGLFAGIFMFSAQGQVPEVPGSQGPDLSVFQLPQGTTFQSVTISNKEFKQFKPDYEFDPKMSEYPARVGQQEAADYVSWRGKKMGVDFEWRPIPQKKYGIIYILKPGVAVDAVATSAIATSPEVPEGMVYVPEGTFMMGSDKGDPDEAPKHSINAGPFYMDRYEVSNAEFQKVFPDFHFEVGCAECPAVVTWEQAHAYAEKVGKRLPTEAEWEKAARGTDGRLYPWGDTFDVSFVAVGEKTPRGGAIAKPESPYGCYDMAGSVWEWTDDWYKPYPGNTTPMDEYGENYKVLRGGASDSNCAMLRTSQRAYLAPNTTGRMRVGFRCVKDMSK